MNFHFKEEQVATQEIYIHEQHDISRISIVAVPVSSGLNDSEECGTDVSIPLVKMKSVEISRQIDQSMQFWSGSHVEEQFKPQRDSQLDYLNLNESEPTASTTHNNQSSTPRESFGGQEIKGPDEQTAFEDKTNLTKSINDRQNELEMACQPLQIDQRHKDFAKELFQLQNKTRKEPKWIIKHLKIQIKRFQGLKLYSHTEQEFIKLSKQNKNVSVTFVQTTEGQKAYQEAISYLERQRSLPPLKWSQPLFKACKDHVLDVGPGGITQSSALDQTKPIDRLKRYGNLEQCWSWADSCIFGALDPLEAFERLLVCDGQQQRGFRNAIFNQDFKLCGISCFDHRTHENVIQLLYVDKILPLYQPKENNQQKPKEKYQPDKCDLLEMAMNSDVYIVCNAPRSLLKKEMALASDPVKLTVPGVPRSVRSPVDFKQPPKVTRNPLENALTAALGSQQMAPSISQKSIASAKSPKVAKENAVLFDKEGAMIGSDKQNQNFGIQLKQYTEKQQQSIWFSNKKNGNQQMQMQMPCQQTPKNVQSQQKKLESKHKRLFSGNLTAVKTMQVKLPPALRQSKHKVKPSFSPRFSPKKSLETNFKHMHTPSANYSRSPPLRIERSNRKVICHQSPQDKQLKSARQTTTSCQSPTWNNSVNLRHRKEQDAAAKQMSENKNRNDKASPQAKISASKQDQEKDEKCLALKDMSDGQQDFEKFIVLEMEDKLMDDRNPFSAWQTDGETVKTFKLEMPKSKETNSTTLSNLKSPTRCATTATTSLTVGSLTRGEGDILCRQKSPLNERCRSPRSFGSNIGRGLQNASKNIGQQGSTSNHDHLLESVCSEQQTNVFSSKQVELELEDELENE